MPTKERFWLYKSESTLGSYAGGWEDNITLLSSLVDPDVDTVTLLRTRIWVRGESIQTSPLDPPPGTLSNANSGGLPPLWLTAFTAGSGYYDWWDTLPVDAFLSPAGGIPEAPVLAEMVPLGPPVLTAVDTNTTPSTPASWVRTAQIFADQADSHGQRVFRPGVNQPGVLRVRLQQSNFAIGGGTAAEFSARWVWIIAALCEVTHP